MVRTTEGIISAIRRMAKEEPAGHLNYSPEQFDKSIEEIFALVTRGMFDRGNLYMRPDENGIWRMYMIQQPMESHNID